MFMMPVHVSILHVVHVGNSCVMKISELAVATSNLLVDLIPKYLDQVMYTYTYMYMYMFKIQSVSLFFPLVATLGFFSSSWLTNV